ncbi:MAG: hypothetical protein AAGG51_02920 [Cyanobacteria bacterium P01_G01_bin.54]
MDIDRRSGVIENQAMRSQLESDPISLAPAGRLCNDRSIGNPNTL